MEPEVKTGSCTNSTAVKQTSHAICPSPPLRLSMVTGVCCLSRGWRIPPARKAGYLALSSTTKWVWGKRQTTVLVPIWWPDEGLQLSPHSSACTSMKGESGGLPWLVAVKTDESVVLGLGPLGSLQGAHYWAGILGLHHRWHATAESAGMVESVSPLTPKVEQLTSEAVFEMFKAVDQVIQ